MLKWKTCVVTAVLALTTGALAAPVPWDDNSDPHVFDRNSVTVLSSLPMAGESTKTPWSDSYWPLKQGSIARRWRLRNQNAWSNHLYSRDELLAMSEQDRRELLETLSPAEKLDIANRDYDYPVTKYVRSHSSPNDASWEGICNGWAAASALYEEPGYKDNWTKVVSRDNITIPFWSSDIKALLSYYYGEVRYANQARHVIGSKCKGNAHKRGRDAPPSPCDDEDLNAGAFHVALVNQVGIKKKPILADLEKGDQVWNHPIYKYETTRLKYTNGNLAERGPSARSADGTVKEILVETTLWAANEIAPRRYSVLGTDNQSTKQKTYRYWLELDSSGRVLGGTWYEGSDHPDFMWLVDPLDFPSDTGSERTIAGRFDGLVDMLGLRVRLMTDASNALAD